MLEVRALEEGAFDGLLPIGDKLQQSPTGWHPGAM